MNKRGQGGSELYVQEEIAHCISQPDRFANYLRENSGVKAYRNSGMLADTLRGHCVCNTGTGKAMPDDSG